MSFLEQALTENTGFTHNGATTHTTSLDPCVDLFFIIGASRGKDISKVFLKAFASNPELATRILLYTRDIRGGLGERDTFRKLVKLLPTETQTKILDKIPEVGRFDDLFTLFDSGVASAAQQVVINALLSENALAAKWTPRQGNIAKTLRNKMGLTPKEFRKLLVTLSDTVEQKMCAGNWDEIDYSKLPSMASSRYQRAFGKHSQERYAEYLSKLEKGETKINASAIYPHDIIKALRAGNSKACNAQWKALPNYLEGSTEQILPVVDVSGSMSCGVGGNGSVSCKDVAVALGIYLAERNNSAFKNEFISFSSQPHFHKLIDGATLEQHVTTMNRSGEDMSTNLIGVFLTLLEKAVKYQVKQEDMPTKLLILSDMEFNQCQTVRIRDGYTMGYVSFDTENVAKIKEAYQKHGYEMPQLVFWNLNAREGNFPVRSNDVGCALVSGFSPATMKALLKGSLTPINVMLDAVMIDRYNF